MNVQKVMVIGSGLMETGDPRFYPPLLLRRKAKAGQLGRKTGKGWYTYNEDGTRKEQGTGRWDISRSIRKTFSSY